jgi:hypothetical protein
MANLNSLKENLQKDEENTKMKWRQYEGKKV